MDICGCLPGALPAKDRLLHRQPTHPKSNAYAAGLLAVTNEVRQHLQRVLLRVRERNLFDQKTGLRAKLAGSGHWHDRPLPTGPDPMLKTQCSPIRMLRLPAAHSAVGEPDNPGPNHTGRDTGGDTPSAPSTLSQSVPKPL